MFSSQSCDRDWSPETRARRTIDIKHNISEKLASRRRIINQAG